MEITRIPLWHFFHDLEKILSYERWIDKYLLLAKALTDGTIIYDAEHRNLRQFLKAVYLQDIRDELRFEELMDTAIAKEEEDLKNIFLAKKASSIAEKKEVKPVETKPAEEVKPKQKEEIPEQQIQEAREMDEPSETGGDKFKYYNPPVVAAAEKELVNEKVKISHYLHTDEYFAVTRRQMIKGWQFLRHKEKSKKEEGLDIEATITQIARDGIFLQPKYLSGFQNRVDTLIIFADCRGSMMPFHELTNRLIDTARSEGGHPRAPVFYFQNYPVGYVYRKPDLYQAVKIKEALITANRNFTLAIVISDAGAARGSNDPEKYALRANVTSEFLNALNQSCAHTIWLNPMPVHRWKNTSASLIKDKVMLMAPILDHDTYNFQDMMRLILKQNQKFLNTV